MQWLIVKPQYLKTMIIGNIYRPPSGSHPKFLETLSSALSNLEDYRVHEIHLSGDFNINFLSPLSQQAKDLLALTKSNGLTQLISTPTRVTPSTKTLIDLYFTNAPTPNLLYYGSHPLNISDHDMIYLIRKKPRQKQTKITFEGRIYKNYNSTMFQNMIRTTDWDDIVTEPDSATAWSMMINRIDQLLSDICPIKQVTLRKPQRPWLTTDVLEQIKFKDDLMIQARAAQDPVLWREAKRTRNRTQNLVNASKAAYIHNELVNSRKDGKSFWRTIHTVLSPAGSSNSPINLQHQNGTVIPPQQAATTINEYFINVASNLLTTQVPWPDPGPQTAATFSLRPPTMSELLKIIRAISVNKSSSIDNISSAVLKDVFLVIPHVVLHIMTQSIITGRFPEDWKRSTVIPIEKIHNANTPSDFRPISLLPLPGKIIEKLVAIQTNEYLESNSILTPHQSGFRKNHSTISTVGRFTDDIFRAMNLNQFTMAIFVDFRKAFDCVDHMILNSKLGNLGFQPTTLSWFKDYLNHRMQRTRANSTNSDYLQVKCGVPQGSILGPILFLIYINDLPKILTNTSFKLYADDTLIYASGTSIQETTAKINTDLDNLAKWCAENKMFINYTKTKQVTFGPPGILDTIPKTPLVSIENTPIHQVTNYKYLGITLDAKLTFNDHVKKCHKAASHKLSLLRRIRPLLTTYAAVQIYKTMILPLLEYGNALYGPANKTLLNKLQVTQNKCLKVALALPKRTPTTQIHEQCGLQRLSTRRAHSTLSQAFSRISNRVQIDKRRIQTRKFSAPVLVVPNYTNQLSQRALEYRCATLWNDLPTHTRRAHSYHVFKRLLNLAPVQFDPP